MNEFQLKQTLRSIQNDFSQWPRQNQDIILKQMIKHIGSCDGELRDQLIYSTFCTLILERHLSEAVVVNLLKTCLSKDFLYKDINLPENDSVFTRSFTSLVIALILHRDAKDRFLPADLYTSVQEALISYLDKEKDARGYVPHKGWAHSIAHASDAFYELIKHPLCAPSIYPDVFELLWKKAGHSHSVFQHDEESRLWLPIISMVERGLPMDNVSLKLRSIPACLPQYEKEYSPECYWNLYANYKLMLQSIFIISSAHEWLQPLFRASGQSINELKLDQLPT
ncbi:DUF2785 domain-containing protein [Bacillus sp. 1P06AnD]|uniref:DUF2785 domain-containing protein n=1 Tax=Bacillus sp. 1P06AnD TaxID=3132208 RepID=UPI0039A291FB